MNRRALLASLAASSVLGTPFALGLTVPADLLVRADQVIE